MFMLLCSSFYQNSSILINSEHLQLANSQDEQPKDLWDCACKLLRQDDGKTRRLMENLRTNTTIVDRAHVNPEQEMSSLVGQEN